jgi:hypothetical protein
MIMQDDLSMPGQHSVYIPVLIGLVALVGLLTFQAVELWQVRGALIGQRDGQGTAIAESDKIRQQLTSIASKTVELAQKGDPDAKAVVEAYAKRGLITFAPPKAPGGGTPVPKP